MLDYLALGILIFVVIIIFYGVIAIHDIPYEIAQHRGHPHQDAIHVAGWVSLFTLHVLWPFLWIWATLYRKDRGWGFLSADGKEESEAEAVLELQQQMKELRKEVAELKGETIECDERSDANQLAEAEDKPNNQEAELEGEAIEGDERSDANQLAEAEDELNNQG
jgi:hypothetical protein